MLVTPSCAITKTLTGVVLGAAGRVIGREVPRTPLIYTVALESDFVAATVTLFTLLVTSTL